METLQTVPGPPPKRSDQRRRRNPAPPAAEVVADGEVRGPKLVGRHSAVAGRFWEALRTSGQAQFFEPSDWAAAELLVVAIDSFMKKPSSMMLASINSAMSNLLVTEGDRRRARLELNRPETPEEAEADVSELADFRRRFQSS